MTRPDDVEARAAFYVMRREEPGWSEQDEAALTAWLGESMAHKAAYWRLAHGWEQADRIRALGPQASLGETRWRLGAWPALMVAATLIAAAIVSIFTVFSQPPAAVAPTAFRTSIGQTRHIGLPDGSKVQLNTATIVRASLTAARREVWLDRGEAFFDVTHEGGRPFVVHAGPRTITVMGTKFAVRRDGDSVTVTVVEGRVRIDPVDPGPASSETGAQILGQGERALVRGNATLLTARSIERVEGELAWRQGNLSFEQSTLAEAAAEFNRYNRRRIVVTDPEIASIRIGGTFQASNADAFIRLLKEAYGLRVVERGDEVVISH